MLQSVHASMTEMKTYHLNLIFPDGNRIVAKAQADSLDDEVEIEWSGATDRLGQLNLGKYSVGFLHWYLRSRAQQLGGEFKFWDGNGSDTNK